MNTYATHPMKYETECSVCTCTCDVFIRYIHIIHHICMYVSIILLWFVVVTHPTPTALSCRHNTPWRLGLSLAPRDALPHTPAAPPTSPAPKHPSAPPQLANGHIHRTSEPGCAPALSRCQLFPASSTFQHHLNNIHCITEPKTYKYTAYRILPPASTILPLLISSWYLSSPSSFSLLCNQPEPKFTTSFSEVQPSAYLPSSRSHPGATHHTTATIPRHGFYLVLSPSPTSYHLSLRWSLTTFFASYLFLPICEIHPFSTPLLNKCYLKNTIPKYCYQTPGNFSSTKHHATVASNSKGKANSISAIFSTSKFLLRIVHDAYIYIYMISFLASLPTKFNDPLIFPHALCFTCFWLKRVFGTAEFHHELFLSNLQAEMSNHFSTTFSDPPSCIKLFAYPESCFNSAPGPINPSITAFVWSKTFNNNHHNMQTICSLKHPSVNKSSQNVPVSWSAHTQCWRQPASTRNNNARKQIQQHLFLGHEKHCPSNHLKFLFSEHYGWLIELSLIPQHKKTFCHYIIPFLSPATGHTSQCHGCS